MRCPVRCHRSERSAVNDVRDQRCQRREIFHEFLAAAGAEVQAGGLRQRAEGFCHQYAVVRMPD